MRQVTILAKLVPASHKTLFEGLSYGLAEQAGEYCRAWRGDYQERSGERLGFALLNIWAW